MQYRFVGDKLQLVKYTLDVTEQRGEEARSYTQVAATDEERDTILKRYPEATVTPVDNTGYEWLDGKTFTQEQINSGVLQIAIEQGEEGYNKYISQNDPNYHIAALEAAVLELAQMMAETNSEAGA